jgi:hypothetical protein
MELSLLILVQLLKEKRSINDALPFICDILEESISPKKV